MHYMIDGEWLLYGLPFAVWKVVELCSRIVVLCVFSSLYTYWVIVVVGVHWLVMAIIETKFRYRSTDYWIKSWVDPQNDFYSKSGEFMQICFNLLIVSPFDILAWVTFGSRKHALEQPVTNGAMTYVENYIMILLWYFLKGVSAWYDLYALILVSVGTAVAFLVLMPMYLKCYSCILVQN
ncbi:endoplasmic reticulum membrane adapter protein XK-like [Branchiostoma floridae x Branchiostoma japonicum]